MDRPFKLKYGTVSPVVLQLVVAKTAIKVFPSSRPNPLGCTFKFDKTLLLKLKKNLKLEVSQCSLIRLDLPCVIVHDKVNY